MGPISSIVVNGTSGANNTLAVQASGVSSETWNVTGAATGNVGGAVTTFTNIENLTGVVQGVGGSLNDTFNLSTGASITGSIVGGGSSNVLSASGTSTTTNWTVSGVNAGKVAGAVTVSGSGFSNIQTLAGGTGTNSLTLNNTSSAASIGTITGSGTLNTLQANNGTNSWSLTGAAAGSLTGQSASAQNSSVGSFTGIQTLNGGAGADNYHFTALASITAHLNPGAGANTLDYGPLSLSTNGLAVSVTAVTASGFTGTTTVTGTGTGSFSSITGITGVYAGNLSGGATNKITGPSATSTWTIGSTDSLVDNFGVTPHYVPERR